MSIVEANFSEAARRLAIDLIAQSLNDLSDEDYRDETLLWFNQRQTTPCGYGWCLHYSGANPNLIRRKINAIYHPSERTRGEDKPQNAPENATGRADAQEEKSSGENSN